MSSEPCVFLVDDDYAVRDSLKLVIEAAGFVCRTFESAEHFLESFCPGNIGVLLLDVNMPGLDGQELQAELSRRHIHLPIIFLTAHGDIPMTVRVIKAGALDFLTKPVSSELLIKRVREALQQEVEMHAKTMEEQALCRRLSGLTAREMEVMNWVVAGLANKEIARKLDISHRTVEIHRARVMDKTGAANLLELVHICETCRLCLKPNSESTLI